jgi:hypothetical protein
VVKVPQSTADIAAHLEDQLQFIERSCATFDAGQHNEAKRLAVPIRVLVHDTQNSKSLLSQLNGKQLKFVSTASVYDPNNLAPHFGLLVLSENQYAAPLDSGSAPARHIAFEEWWNESVFMDSHRRLLSRKTLVLTTTNQDGGAHVDPELDELYADLSRNNSMGYLVEAQGKMSAMVGAELFALRQIAHEVLKTLRPGYEKHRENLGRIEIANFSIRIGDSSGSPIRNPGKLGRNAPCHCGSGRKFKHCHGRAPGT